MSRKSKKVFQKSVQSSNPKTDKSNKAKKVEKAIFITAAIATIIGTFWSIFCGKDYSDDINNAVDVIKKQTFVMVQMPDSLLEMPTVKQARDVQKKILTIKDYIGDIDFAPRDNEDTQMGIYRYVKEMERFQSLCNEVIRLNDLFSAFVENNPQYGTMFNLDEYKKTTSQEMELIPKIQNDIKASNGKDKSPEQKIKLLETALNSKEMLDFMDIQRSVLQQIFEYMNKVQREIKLNQNN